MADKPRKRKPNASCSEDVSSKDYHAVDISDSTAAADARWRRRSAGNSNSSTGSSSTGGSRGESWMTKVTSAMSQRIFSGKKLGASRSTQQQQHKLRQVSSEHSFTRASVESPASEPVLLTPVEKVDFCPSVAIHVRGKTGSRTQSSNVIGKVAPSDQENGDDPDFDTHASASRRAAHSEFAALPPRASCSSGRRDNEDGELLQDTAPILKDFFTRNASVGQGLRVQQRESRREAVYKNSLQRQERLRRRVEAESRELETQQRRLRAEQLQRATHQRRVRVRREAAVAHKHLASRLASDTNSFERERERWEGEFEDEMRLLGRAFCKASAKTARSGLSGCEDDGDSSSQRPATVAGLAVPQALAQIRRDASNYEKRLKTAAPRRGRDAESSRENAMGGRRRDSASSLVDGFQSASAHGSGDESVADDDDDYDYEALLICSDSDRDDDDAAAVELGFVARDGVELAADGVRALTVEELLDERRRLLQRIAELEELTGGSVVSPT
ncbi:hypothetical protein PybrP1_008283 [[Pythium] brassicae (nom. inval.)]|nr:hypothetical protein PybrP1_008283 [[Pythium] brassicae (nom. inval.)]